jgi:acyl-[acyl-carrier-protein]-phospholipid O-acyltransferase/long-chain-fatty-acid--[acyl-carrier-protein] ligase
LKDDPTPVPTAVDQQASPFERRPLDPARWHRSLFDALIENARRKPEAAAIEDQDRSPLTYKRLVLASFVLGRKFAQVTGPGERVAVMLPNVNAVAVTMFGLFAYGRVPAMLNFTAGIEDIRSAIASAEARKLVTSRRFIETAKLDAKIEALKGEVEILYLEDVRESAGLVDRLVGLLRSRRPEKVHRRFRGSPDDIAVILFTSGTERRPKAVALTHANLLSNIEQVQVSIDCTEDDVLLNPLPVFHAFGLTAGMLLPLVIGFRGVLFPSPLQYEAIPKLARETGTTILIGIDTFAAGWARAASPDDFRSLRLMVLGAEKVKDATRKLWLDRCGIEILEGYGVTEASPVVAVNLPGQNRIGTVGPLLPGIEMRLEPVEGIEVGEKLIVRGPNVMAGYIFPDKPGVLHPPPDGWHDTGDIVTVDEAGAIAIVGRAKRFAKVAGEMVSLAAAETLLREAAPDGDHAIVAVPDRRKGESLVLVTTMPGLTVSSLRTRIRDLGASDLMVPSKVILVDALPLLGNGKTDYVSLEKLAAGSGAKSGGGRGRKAEPV